MKSKSFKHVSGKKYDGFMGRCYRDTDQSYPNYGARGIRVCKKWILDINNFRDWLRMELQSKEIPIDDFIASPRKYQLDRINVDSHYMPENCRIVDAQTNSRNKRNSNKRTVISAEGEEICI